MNIYVEHENCMIWNTEDILKLQKERKLGSSLIGVLVPPPYDKTNVKTKNSRILKNRIGRPLLLMKEEIAILKDTEKFLETKIEKPTKEEIEIINQQQLLANQKMKDYYQHKRNKHRKFYGVNRDDKIVGDVESQCILVPTESATNNCKVITNMRLLHSDFDKLKCAVYKDLWMKGFYITNAAKFGGDFLVYPGEPNRFHSYYIAMCYSDRSIELVELANLIRIGVAVKKHVILCYRGGGDDDQLPGNHGNGRGVKYITLSWSGIV